MTTPATVLPRWTIAAPFVAWIVLGVAYALPGNGLLLALIGVALCAAVFTAVHHAEVVAHRVGEPFGTLVLAVAVTVIEVALIVSVMLTSGPEKAGLARDTVFAAVMIVCNGIVGVCLLVGGIRHREQDFQSRGAAAALAVLASLSVLTLVMPNYTTTKVGPVLSSSQLAFAGVSSLVLYGVFVFVQTVRHRDYFLAGVPDEDVPCRPAERRPRAGKRRLAAGVPGRRRIAGEGALAGGRNRGAERGRRRRRWSALSLPRWCCCQKDSRPCAQRAPIACRTA